MKILSAKTTQEVDGVTVCGVDVNSEQIQKDLPEITRLHEKNMKSPTLWCYFGGMIDIENRTYQVCP